MNVTVVTLVMWKTALLPVLGTNTRTSTLSVLDERFTASISTSLKSVAVICFLVLLCAAGSLSAQNSGSAAHDYIGIYQKHLSGIYYSRCQMYPSCSRYGIMVFEDRPFPVAMVMMADRMMRCGNHPDCYVSVTDENGNNRLLDYPPSRPVPAQLQRTLELHDVAAETVVPTDSVSKAIQFINTLVNRHCYASALLEIERLLFYDTSFRLIPELYINKMRCYEGMYQYSDGILFFEQSVPSSVRQHYKTMYTAAHLYDLVGDNNRSIALFKESAKVWDSSEVHPYGELTLLYTKESLLDDAMSALEHKYEIDGNVAAFAASRAAIDRLATARYKNVTTASLLAIIPGAGYLYAKQPGSAITSLLTNGLLAYAAYSSFKADNYGLGILVGLFSVSFYIGNIVGSGSSATRYNERIRREAVVELRNINPFFY